MDEKSTWTKPQQDLDSLAIEIHQTAKKMAKGFSGWEGGGNKYCAPLTIVIGCAVIHICSRELKLARAPEKNRTWGIEWLSSRFIAEAIRDRSSIFTTEARRNRMKEEISTEFKESNTLYEKCVLEFPKEHESSKGTLIWEIGKNFAEAANMARNVTFMSMGSREIYRLVASTGVVGFIESLKID